MRAAIYNRFWHSQGGGERHSGMIGQVLSHDGVQVDLVGHTEFDRDELGDHLGLDLSKVDLRIVPDRGDLAMGILSGDYDLWVNGSYMSRIAPQSAKAAYLCYFPTPSDANLPAWKRTLASKAGHLVAAQTGGLEHGVGWYPPEFGRRRRWNWASGDAVLTMTPSDRERVVRLHLGGPGLPAPTEVQVVDEAGTVLFETTVTAKFRPHRFRVPATPRGAELRFLSKTFRPPNDKRELAFAVSGMHIEGGRFGPRQRIAFQYPWLVQAHRDLSFLDSYDAVMANSEFTRGWIARLWERDADVLFPPIQVQRMHPAAEREQAVVTVGRFFAPGLGHAKRQKEMVEFFATAYRAGRLPDWKMYVVGGMEDSQRGYVETVRTAGAGCPVEVIPNAPRGRVEELLSTASVFWSATGYGEDEDKSPWSSEHFGMTTVEAMAGGCVPVVIDRAGQKEIVRDGVDGFRWTTPAQLIDRTLQVAHDTTLRQRLAASAVERAQAFSEDAFAERWHSIVAKHSLLG